MISVISSYRLPAQGESFSDNLNAVCRELQERGFLGVDVLIREEDVIARLNGTLLQDLSAHDIKKVAESLAEDISNAVRPGRGVPLAVPALASSFPDISCAWTDSDEELMKRWKSAVNAMAVCLVVADIIGTRVLEIVCGCVVARHHRLRTRINAAAANPSPRDVEIAVSSEDMYVEDFKTSFARGVVLAFLIARNAFEQTEGMLRLPRVAVALEIEPDRSALGRDLTALQKLIEQVESICNDSNHLLPFGEAMYSPALASTLDDPLVDHFGFNLDWGHLLVGLDRINSKERKQALLDLKRDLARDYMKSRVLHGHVADHARGAHWVDAPLGRFRPLEKYAFLACLHTELIQEMGRDKWPPKRGCERFRSGAVAIELEARHDVALAVECRDKLYQLGVSKDTSQTGGILPVTMASDTVSMTGGTQGEREIDLETPRDKLRHVEGRIGAIDVKEVSKGWLEGINRIIYDSLDNLLRQTPLPKENDATLLLNKDILKLIRAFLATQKVEERTRKAVEIARETFRRLNLDALDFWFNHLLSDEWSRAFYTKYREHTVHSVYVYLLGLYLYAESAVLREILKRRIKSEKTLERPRVDAESPFFAQWALAALAHDIGYPYEGQGDRPKHALDELNWVLHHFVHSCLYARERGKQTLPDREKFSWENDVLLHELSARHLVHRFESPPEVLYDSVFSRTSSSPEASLVAILHQQEEAFGLRDHRHGFQEIFHFLRFHSPDRAEDGRPAFLDHGMMSAATLCAVLQAYGGWHKKISHWYKEASAGSVSLPQDGKVRKWVKKETPVSHGVFVTASGNFTEFAKEAIGAVAVHNLVPEREEWLYKAESINECPALQNLKTRSSSPIALLLQICDSLQEWHRHGFADPTQSKKLSLSPVEVNTFVPPNGVIQFEFTNSDECDKGWYKDKMKELRLRMEGVWKRLVSLEEGLKKAPRNRRKT